MSVIIDGTNGITTPTTLNDTSAFGYTTGSGGTVTQLTSKSTAVTLNKPTGQITMNNAALAANTSAAFTLNNTLIAADDILVVVVSGAGQLLNYNVRTRCLAGTATIAVKNETAGSLSDAVVLNFAVIKGATS